MHKCKSSIDPIKIKMTLFFVGFANEVSLAGHQDGLLLLALPLYDRIEGEMQNQDRLMRTATIDRKTNETDISVAINLDGTGQYDNKTGVGFFDHMLDQLSRHSLIDMSIGAKGDTHIDDHHTVEDCGIALGQALVAALGDKKGIARYGHYALAMDDAQVRVALDLSARPFLICNLDFKTQKIGQFDVELVREFFQALSTHGGITLHIDQVHGVNSHHIAEAAFKSVARALRMAVEPDARMLDTLPSTKGAL